ncbi:hypothetical protein ACWEK5_47970, partial [Rhodococcus koreensis]
MTTSIRLSSVKCVEEINEASASEEVFILLSVADLRPPSPGLPIPPIPNSEVFHTGVLEDMDDDDPPRLVDGPVFWGMNGQPARILDPAHVAIAVTAVEQDNQGPGVYAVALRAQATAALTASAGDPDPRSRGARFVAAIRDMASNINELDIPIPFTLDDDHIATEQLILDSADLAPVGVKEKELRIKSSQGDYLLRFKLLTKGWLHGRPGAGHPAVKPGTSPTGWYTHPENVQHIGYVGTDDQIHELFYFIGGDGLWHHGTPGAGHPAVKPGTSPTGWYTHPENVQHIGYVGT